EDRPDRFQPARRNARSRHRTATATTGSRRREAIQSGRTAAVRNPRRSVQHYEYRGVQPAGIVELPRRAELCQHHEHAEHAAADPVGREAALVGQVGRADWAVLRRKPSEQAAHAPDGKAVRKRRNPRGVTKWGPAGIADKPLQGRFFRTAEWFSPRNGPIVAPQNFREASGFSRT